MGRNVEVIGDVHIFIDRMNEKVDKALTKVGMLVESSAKSMAPHDTGLLRNSITYALSGGPPAKSSYAADNGSNRRNYSGEAEDEGEGAKSVIIGTGVEYAAYQELGHHTKNGKWIPPQAFLKPAAEGCKDQIKTILETELKPD